MKTPSTMSVFSASIKAAICDMEDGEDWAEAMAELNRLGKESVRWADVRYGKAK